jgi:hypothetical protein
MKLRIVVVGLALALVVAVLVISGRRAAPIEEVVVDSATETEPSASPSEADPRRPEPEAAPVTAEPANFGITEDEYNEFKRTLLHSLDQQFRASIDAQVEASWDTPDADGNRPKLEDPRSSLDADDRPQ